ncbi:MAG: hypothetical protein K2X66_15490 [Cyanobacteria bacterium]|nr:hypothetical protein [Cyanobacteriota bacterium]
MNPIQFGGVTLLTQSQAKKPGYFDLRPEHPEVTQKFDAFVADYRKKQGASVPVEVYYASPNKRLLVDGPDVEALKKDIETQKAANDKRHTLTKLIDYFSLSSNTNPETVVQNAYQLKAVTKNNIIDLDAPKA